MKTDTSEAFPRLEFKRSKLPYRLAMYAISAVLPGLAIKAVYAVMPPGIAISPAIVLFTWCLMAAGCFVLLMKLLSKVDFEKRVLIIEPDGVTIAGLLTKMLPWASISKVKFHESGQFRQTKVIAFHVAGVGTEMADVSYIAGISARHLFDTVRTYHRAFGPQPATGGGSSYNSIAWTGLDDE